MTEGPMIVCIGCPTLIPKGSGSRRCLPCRRAHDAKRNAEPTRVARRNFNRRNPIPLGATCACCGSAKDITREHRTALIKGGPLHDIAYWCRSCNSSKGTGDRCNLNHTA